MALPRLSIGSSYERQGDKRGDIGDNGIEPTPVASSFATAVAEVRQHVQMALGDLRNERASVESAAAEAMLRVWAKNDCAASPPLAEWTQFQQTLQRAEQLYQQAAEDYAGAFGASTSPSTSACDRTMSVTLVQLNVVRVHKMLVKALLDLEPSASAASSKPRARANKSEQQPARCVAFALSRQEIADQLRDPVSKVLLSFSSTTFEIQTLFRSSRVLIFIVYSAAS